MDLTPYLDALRDDFLATAAAISPDSAVMAERLATALDATTRMMLLEALTQAAAEISTELAGGSVEVCLRGRQPEFVVTAAPPPSPPQPPLPPPPFEDLTDDDTEASARITLRIPQHLKQQAEELAGKQRQSLNTWLVDAVRRATQQGVSVNFELPQINIDIPQFGRRPGSSDRSSYQGWAK